MTIGPYAMYAEKKIRVLSSPRQRTRHSRVTQNELLTAAAFRP